MSEELSDILHVLAHDLRSPLNVIHGYVEMLRMDKTELSEAHQNFLEIIGRNVQKMDALLSDVTDQAEKPDMVIIPEFECIPVTDVEQIIGNLLPVKGIHCTQLIKTDRNILLRILQSVIQMIHAISSTPETVTCALDTNGSLLVIFTVQGMNISDTDIIRLFHKIHLSGQGRTKGISLYETSCRLKAIHADIHFERTNENTHEIRISFPLEEIETISP